jgi:hypothetical protein
MLASADECGVVRASVGGLAHLSRVDAEACREAIARLMAPDDDSRTKEHEGRRIEEVEGGWRLLNWAKYQAPVLRPQPTEQRREYMRNYIASRRAAGTLPVSPKKPKREQLQLDGDSPEDTKGDRLPTSPDAIFVSDLFSRRHSTAWNAKEIRAFKDAVRRGVFTEENRASLLAYYTQERAKGRDGIHRRDLLTFLNNIDGEIDRARSKCAGLTPRTNNGSAHQTTAAASAANSGTTNAAHARKY